MKRTIAVVAVLLLSGCAYFEPRGRDLGDIFRLEGSIGVGLQANATAGELLHLGIGSSRRWSGGWAYGMSTSERRVEDHFPLSFVSSCLNPEITGLHTLKSGGGPEHPQHRCAAVAPGAFSSGTVRKPAMQYFNLEVGFMAVVLGVEAGFNPAELVDFVLGIFGLDIAGDDAVDVRSRRRLWIPADPELFSER